MCTYMSIHRNSIINFLMSEIVTRADMDPKTSCPLLEPSPFHLTHSHPHQHTHTHTHTVTHDALLSPYKYMCTQYAVHIITVHMII